MAGNQLQVIAADRQVFVFADGILATPRQIDMEIGNVPVLN